MKSNRPPNRFRRRAAIGVLTAAATLLTATASSAAATTPTGTVRAPLPAAAEGPQGGVLRYATVSEPTTLDPHKGTSGGDHVSLYPIYDTLLTADPATLETQPGLATEWDYPDDNSLRLVLREDVTFTDGTPFNAEAVVYNIDRGVNMEDSSVKPELSAVESVEAVGDYEVLIHLTQPDSSLLGVFTDRAGMMVSPAAAEADPDFGLNQPVGTGPHMLTNWNQGIDWSYERNPDYWQEGLPYLDGLEFTLLADSNTRVNGLRSGQFDFVDSLEPIQLTDLQGVDGLTVDASPTLLEHMIWWNMGRAPLDDVRVRRAINLAIDREAMWAGTMEGTGEVAWLPIPSTHWAFTEDLVPTFAYDPDQARALLEEAGYADGFTLVASSSNAPDAVRRAEILQANLAEIGIDFQVRPQQTVESVEAYFESQRVDAYNSSMTARADPSITYQTMFSNTSYHNTGKWSPDGFEDLLAEAKSVTDPEARAEVFARINAMVVDQAMWVPLVYPDSITALSNEFTGFTPSLIGKADFLTVHLAE
ncbi:MAG: ABC transporter substrate-binding protein [Desertimonas sp.]